MRHFVIELRKVKTTRYTYATIQSKHNSFAAAIRARDTYIKQDLKNKESVHCIRYVIGRI